MHGGGGARPAKRPLSEISAEKKATQQARSAFLDALKSAERVEIVRELGHGCRWPQVKNFNGIYSRSPLHLAVTMLDRRHVPQPPFTCCQIFVLHTSARSRSSIFNNTHGGSPFNAARYHMDRRQVPSRQTSWPLVSFLMPVPFLCKPRDPPKHPKCGLSHSGIPHSSYTDFCTASILPCCTANTSHCQYRKCGSTTPAELYCT